MVKKFLLITIMILTTFTIVKADSTSYQYNNNNRVTWNIYTANQQGGNNLLIFDENGFTQDFDLPNSSYGYWVYMFVPVDFTINSAKKYNITISTTYSYIAISHNTGLFPNYPLLNNIGRCSIYRDGGSTSDGCRSSVNTNANNITFTNTNIVPNGNGGQIILGFFINGYNQTIPFNPDNYTIYITESDSYGLTGGDYQAGVNNIINNQNNNTNAIINNQNNNTQEIIDSITDDDIPNNTELNDSIDDWNDSLSSENALSDFILMPFTILNNISSGLRARCETFNLGSLLGHNIVLPCIDIEDYLGTNLWVTIDSLFCLYMIYNIAMLFIQAFEGITTLRDDFDSLYTPQHGDFGYKPRHGGD